MEKIKNIGPGVGLCLLMAVPCWLLGKQFPIIGGPVFAILAGMVIALFYKEKKITKQGITYTSKKILQYAVILLGFGMNLSEIARVGAASLPIIVSTISVSLIVSFVLYKLMKMPANISTLIGGRILHLRRFRHCGDSSGDRRRRRGNRPGDFRGSFCSTSSRR